MKKTLLLLTLIFSFATVHAQTQTGGTTADAVRRSTTATQTINGPIVVKKVKGGTSTGVLTGAVESHFNDTDMAAGTYNASLASNAIATTDTVNVLGGRAVNNFWVETRGLLDSNFGLGSYGRQINSILIDHHSDSTTGGVSSAFKFADFPADSGYLGYGGVFTIRRGSGAGHTGADWYSSTYSGFNYTRGGQIWLTRPDSNGKVAVVAAPTGVTSTTTSGSGNLAAGHYRFMVAAVNDAGEGLPSSATTDLTITSGQVISVSWNQVTGARGYKLYAAYNSGSDPGTTLTNYHFQYTQTATKYLKGVIYEETGAGSYTGYLANHYHDGTNLDEVLINDNPLAEDRSGFYFFRVGAQTNSFIKPSFDLFSADGDGKWIFRPTTSVSGHPFSLVYPSAGSLSSFFRVWDGSSTNYLNLTAAGVLETSGIPWFSKANASGGITFGTNGMGFVQNGFQIGSNSHFYVPSGSVFASGATANTGYQILSSPTAARVGVGIQLAASQTANAITVLSNTATTLFSVTAGGTITQTNAAVTATSGGTTTLDLSTGNVRTVTMPSGNTTLTASNVPVGFVAIAIIQDATGSRTVTWNSLFKWASGTAPTLSTGASKRDQFFFQCDGSSCFNVGSTLDVR